MSNPLTQDYNSYLGLYKNPSFVGSGTPFNQAFTSITAAYSDNDRAIFLICSMTGFVYTNESGTIPVPATGIQVDSIFYNFWNNSDNIQESRTLIQAYVIGTQENLTGVNNFALTNYFVTYILSYLFSAAQYDPSGNPVSQAPNLLNPRNNQPAVENVKLFLQGLTSPSDNNLLGTGNYQITDISGPLPTSLIENKGFVKLLCDEQYQLFKNKNTNLKGQKLINTFRNEISQNPTLLSYCGCFAPLPEFFRSKIRGFTSSGDAPCDPLCYNNQVFKLYDFTVTKNGTIEGGGVIKECNDQVCVIDNNSINSLNSNGNINFNQTCKGCLEKNSGCLCFLDVSTKGLANKISSGNDGMVSQPRYRQNCPGNSVCFKYNDGEIQEVPCNKDNTPGTGSLFDAFKDGLTKVTNPKYIPDFFWFFVMIIFFFLFMLIYEISRY